MTVKSTPPKSTTPPSTLTEKPVVVHRTITLRVDLRVLAALGGALIIVGALLPWVTPQFQPIVRVLSPASSGGWPLLIIGALAIVLQFWPQFTTPRVSLPAAALGFAAGLWALASALETISLGRTTFGETFVSPLAGIGLGVYLTVAGSIIAILAGLAPQPPNHEPARAELRLWKSSAAIVGALVVLYGLGAILFGSWLGAGASAGRIGTPTPPAIDAGVLATPLINVQVDPMSTPESGTGPDVVTPPPVGIPTEAAPTPLIPIEPTATFEVPPTETRTPTRAPTLSSTATHTLTPTPTISPTPGQSPLGTGTPTPTSTPTSTSTPTPTATSGS